MAGLIIRPRDAWDIRKSGGGGDKEDTMDKQYPAGLPDYCYSIGPKTRAPVKIYR